MITIANTAFTVTDTVELARSTTDPITAPAPVKSFSTAVFQSNEDASLVSSVVSTP